MSRRQFRKCGWCDKTIDVTNNDDELCGDCSCYTSFNNMVRQHHKIHPQLFVAFEFGYKQREKGRNFEAASSEFWRLVGDLRELKK